MNITPHFTYEELIHSDYASRHDIDNTPDPKAENNLIYVLAPGMEQVRQLLLHNPIFIHSAYRNPVVNEAVGGSSTSAHMRGLACDFSCPGFGSPFLIATAIEASLIKFDQLILEYGWVHIAFPEKGASPRYSVLTKKSASAPYVKGIVA